MGFDKKPVITYLNPNEEGFAKIFLRDDSGMTVCFSVDPLAPEVEILYEMAFRIPTAYVEFYSVGLPVVPGTERPAEPIIIHDSVVWEDPSGQGSWSCTVGKYGLDLGHGSA